jgi:hypothetical protein
LLIPADLALVRYESGKCWGGQDGTYGYVAPRVSRRLLRLVALDQRFFVKDEARRLDMLAVEAPGYAAQACS